MILFINGFVPTQWAPGEFKRDAAGYAKLAAAYVGYTQFLGDGNTMMAIGIERHQQMAEEMRIGMLHNLRDLVGNSYTSEKNTRNPYLPARNLTPYNPVYNGDAYDYWGDLKGICSSLLKDEELAFINASSENTSTGAIRYADGRRTGETLVRQWDVYERNERAKSLLNRHNGGGKLTSREMEELAKQFPEYSRSITQMESRQIGMAPLNEVIFGTVGNAINSYTRDNINNALHFRQGETLTIVAHSQGCAFAAGLASVIARHAAYRNRLNAVFYLAPHDPAGFEHPAGVPGYQSSCKTDWVVSISTGAPEMPAHMKEDSMLKRIATKVKGVEFSFLKGPANYTIIKNIPPQNYLENTTYAEDEITRHGVVIYKDEMRHLIVAHLNRGHFGRFQQYMQMRQREGRLFQGQR
jgi:hypothetical protein